MWRRPNHGERRLTPRDEALFAGYEAAYVAEAQPLFDLFSPDARGEIQDFDVVDYIEAARVLAEPMTDEEEREDVIGYLLGQWRIINDPINNYAQSEIACYLLSVSTSTVIFSRSTPINYDQAQELVKRGVEVSDRLGYPYNLATRYCYHAGFQQAERFHTMREQNAAIVADQMRKFEAEES